MAMIKAGTYTVDKMLSRFPYDYTNHTSAEIVTIHVEFTVEAPMYYDGLIMGTGIELLGPTYNDPDGYRVDRFDYHLSDEFADIFGTEYITVMVNCYEWVFEEAKTITVLKDTEVTPDEETWFYSNFHLLSTEPDTPTASGAVISYNGSTIASLVGGQTATLKCKDMVMEDDVVIIMSGGEENA